MFSPMILYFLFLFLYTFTRYEMENRLLAIIQYYKEYLKGPFWVPHDRDSA